MGEASAFSTEQNVVFKDTHPGYSMGTESAFDSVRDAPLIQDATLDEFFSRPLRIASFDWGVGTTLFQNLNPWNLYFANTRVINRIANYKLMRATLHVKVLINGNSFHYGRAILAYNPLPNLDEMTITRAFLDADVVAASQRPHIYLDPTNSQGGELTLPFFWHKNLLDIVAQDWNELGELDLFSIQGLKHANGAVDAVSVTLFAWATDVRFAIPTEAEPGSISPQGDEYGQGIVSKPASIIANIASRLTTAPIIGFYARATQIGASSVAALATLFGYSNPVLLTHSVYKPVTKANLATTSGEDDATKLTVDPKQELTLDSRTVGLTGVDELSITAIATRESFLTNFDWPVGTSQETILWNTIVDPMLHRVQANELHFPACAFAALPFDYWRGSMNVRFQVVCSKYHKGRLKIVYDPNSTPLAGVSEYNTAYTTIVDISDTTDFTITCGWGQATSYRQHIFVPILEQLMFTTTPLLYASNAVDFGNGTLSVYVVNELTVPDSTINNDIQVNVFISMGDDFEVAQPNGDLVSRLRLTEPQGLEILPQAQEAPPEEHERMDSQPYKPPAISQAATTIPIDDMTNYIHFGESIRSFRQMLKRYNLHETTHVSTQSSGNNVLATKARQSLPFEPGYTSSAGTIPYTLTAGDYAYAQMTLMRYLSTAYAGWRGSVRWTWDFSGASLSFRNTTVIVGRQANSAANLDAEETITAVDSAVSQAELMNVFRDVNGQQGSTITNTQVNPVVSFEVPFYSEYRFAPAKALASFSLSANELAMPYYDVKYKLQTSGIQQCLYSWCAAGEDFNLFYFLGAPIFYFENSYPNS